ncbi:MAG: hypothetical protein EA426_18625 [Spirochaetaceae bacterium]|nr:MAG: hypothetical protein EA426_18625 [Spirochaetaceae bacterium]
MFPADHFDVVAARVSDPRYAAVWAAITESADAVRAAGSLELPGDTSTMYYHARGRLMDLALAAAVTRDESYYAAYAEIIRGLSRRELNFWIGPEYPNRPRHQVIDGVKRYTGELETAALASGIAISFDWIKPLADAELRDVVYATLLGTAYPLLKNSTVFQSARWVMNHLCVISSALTLVVFAIEGIRASVPAGPLARSAAVASAADGAAAARTADDPILFSAGEAERIADSGIPVDDDVALIVRALGSWMKTIDSDGSYGEGFHYWAYPINCLFFALEALRNVREIVPPETACLRRSLEWTVYNQVGMYEHPEFPRPVAVSVNTYDCPYVFGLEAPEVLLYQRFFRDPLASWYIENFLLPNPPRPDALHTAFHVSHAALFALDDRDVAPRSPAEQRLPPSRVFHDTGFVYLRDGWDGIASAAGDTVFALASGGGGRANSHQHFDKNSFSLFSRGEYWIVDPGHSCYRGASHSEYDPRTRAHNTLSIDGEDQALGFVEKGMMPDERKSVISHHNRAEVVCARHYALFDYIESDGRRCYEPWLAAFSRRVWFIRNDYFVIWDRIDLGAHAGRPRTGFNLNNRDGRLSIEEHTTGLRASRPNSDLAVEFAFPANVARECSNGRLHLAYHMKQDMPVEGRDGSARRIDLVPPDGVRAFDTVLVIAPLETGEAAPVVTVENAKGTEIGNRVDGVSARIDFRGRRTEFLFGERTIVHFDGTVEYTV